MNYNGNVPNPFVGDVDINGNIKAEDAEFNNVHVLNNLDVDGTFTVGNSVFDNIQITNPANLTTHALTWGSSPSYYFEKRITNLLGLNYFNFVVSNGITTNPIYFIQPVTGVMQITNISTLNQITLNDSFDSWNLTNVRAANSGMVLKSSGGNTLWQYMFDQELNKIDRPVFGGLTISRVDSSFDAVISFYDTGGTDWVMGVRKASDTYDFDIRVSGTPIIGLNAVGNSYILPELDLIVQARTLVVTSIPAQDAIFTIDAPTGKIPVSRWTVNGALRYNMIVDLSGSFIINNYLDGGKGVIAIDGATSLITLNDDVVINGYVKIEPITEPARPVDGKTLLYSKFDQDPYFNNSAGINYTTDNTGFRMVPPLAYCETSFFGNTLPVAFSGIAPEWVTIPTNVNLVLGKTNIAKYTTYQTTGAQLSVFNPPRDIRYKCECSFTCLSTSAGAAVLREFAIWVNGVEQRGKQGIQNDDSTAVYPMSNTIMCIIDVTANISNIILLRARNPNNETRNVVVPDLTFILTELQ